MTTHHDDDEIEPFLIYRLQAGRLECALVPLDDGQSSLALFQRADAAEAYSKAAGLPAEWRVMRPAKADLLRILEHCLRSGVAHAVLDPGQDEGQRLFDLREVVTALRDTSPG